MQISSTERTQIFYARVAGFVYLLLIALFMSGEFLISGIVGNGSFATAAQNVASSEHLYRFALILQTMTSVFTVVLAYALYVTVAPINQRLAQVALIFRLGEIFVGAVAVIFSFDQLRIYLSFNAAKNANLEQWQALFAVARNAHFVGFNIATLFFSFGSILFFSLFFRSRYLPKIQSAFGIFASIMVALTSIGSLVVPEYADIVQFGFAPIFISEIVTGLWLLCRGIKLA